jgi:hypothetical protein
MLKLKYSAVAVFISFFLNGQHPVINEAVNNPFNLVEDIDGDFPSWVELCNPTSKAIVLDKYYLSPAENDLQRYRIHDEILYPNTYTVIAFSGKNRVDWKNIHANFEWTNLQQRLYLSDSLGNVIDFLEMPGLPYDRSYGRKTDGDTVWQAFAEPSPGAANAGQPVYTPSK